MNASIDKAETNEEKKHVAERREIRTKPKCIFAAHYMHFSLARWRSQKKRKTIHILNDPHHGQVFCWKIIFVFNYAVASLALARRVNELFAVNRARNNNAFKQKSERRRQKKMWNRKLNEKNNRMEWK